MELGKRNENLNENNNWNKNKELITIKSVTIKFLLGIEDALVGVAKDIFEFASHPIDGVVGVEKSIMGYLPEIANKIKNGERVERIVDSIRGSKGAGNPKLFKVSESALKHSSVGDFTYNPKTGKVSKMKGGGHGQANIDFLDANGLEYEIVDTYPNGVRVGNVADHKVKAKRTGSNQSWFPESWTDSDIVNAGEYVGNLKENINAVDGVISYGEVNGVRVGVIRTDGEISTIFPDATMQP